MSRARGAAEEHDHASDPTAYWDAVARGRDESPQFIAAMQARVKAAG